MNRNDIIRQLRATSDKLADEALYLRSFASDLKTQERQRQREDERFSALLDEYRDAAAETARYVTGSTLYELAAEQERDLRAALLRMFTERP